MGFNQGRVNVRVGTWELRAVFPPTQEVAGDWRLGWPHTCRSSLSPPYLDLGQNHLALLQLFKIARRFLGFSLISFGVFWRQGFFPPLVIPGNFQSSASSVRILSPGSEVP